MKMDTVYLARLPRKYKDVPFMLSKSVPIHLMIIKETDGLEPVVLEPLVKFTTEASDSFFKKLSNRFHRDITKRYNLVDHIIVNVNPSLYSKEVSKPDLYFRSRLANNFGEVVSYFSTTRKPAIYAILSAIFVTLVGGCNIIFYNNKKMAEEDSPNIYLAMYILLTVLSLIIGSKVEKWYRNSAFVLLKRQKVIVKKNKHTTDQDLLFESGQLQLLTSIRPTVKKAIQDNDSKTILKLSDSLVNKIQSSNYTKQYYHNQIRNLSKSVK